MVGRNARQDLNFLGGTSFLFGGWSCAEKLVGECMRAGECRARKWAGTGEPREEMTMGGFTGICPAEPKLAEPPGVRLGAAASLDLEQ